MYQKEAVTFTLQKQKRMQQVYQDVAKKKQAKKVVKSKSMVTEEISMNHALEEIGCEVLESDLGEYILQVDNDPPSHIIAPALHKTERKFVMYLKKNLDMKILMIHTK